MENSELIPGLDDLYHSCNFYWGNIDRNEAERILKEKPNGSYLLKDRIREAHETTLESLGDNTEIIWYSDKEEGIYHSDQKFLLEFAYKFNSSIYYAIYTEDLYNQQCKEAIESRGGIWCPKQNGGLAYFENCTSRTEFLVRFGIHAAVNYDENQDDDQDEYEDLHVRNKIYHSNCKLRIEFAAKCTIPVVRRNVFSLKELTKTAVLNKNYEITYENITSLGIPKDLQNYLRESLPKPELIPGVYDLYNSCKFYWGNIDRKEAEAILKNEPEGSFLLKDRTREKHERNYMDLDEYTDIIHFSHAKPEEADNICDIYDSYRNFLFEFAYKLDDFDVHYAIVTEKLYKKYVDQLNKGPDANFMEEDEWKELFPMDIRIRKFIVEKLVRFSRGGGLDLFGAGDVVWKNYVVRNKIFSLKQLSRAAILNTELTYDKIFQLDIPDILKNYLVEYRFKFGVDLLLNSVNKTAP